jgi:hypothetical protein
MTVFGVALALVLVPGALAATPTQRGYGGSAGEVQQQVDRGGTLPFTGLDLGLMAGGGVLLIVLGTGLWRVTRHRA